MAIVNYLMKKSLKMDYFINYYFVVDQYSIINYCFKRPQKTNPQKTNRIQTCFVRFSSSFNFVFNCFRKSCQRMKKRGPTINIVINVSIHCFNFVAMYFKKMNFVVVVVGDSTNFVGSNLFANFVVVWGNLNNGKHFRCYQFL